LIGVTPKIIKKNIEIAFLQNFGYKLDLENVETLSEKMQWLRVYGNTPLHSKLADKFEAREYVRERIGEDYLVPLLAGPFSCPDEIDFSVLPDKFVIKCTHGCGYNIIVKDKKNFDQVEAKKTISKWMNENFSHQFGEIHYSSIKPRIIIEKYLQNTDGNIFDYKYFCFNGTPSMINYIFARTSGLPKNSFFSLNWENKNFTNFGELVTGFIPPPRNLNLMNDLALKLCNDFLHIRVDFYNIEGKIFFGEFTFTTSGGYLHFSPEIDRELGNLLDLSNAIKLPYQNII